MIKNSYAILKEVYGYDDFRPIQKEIIDHVTAGKNALALLPTGGGKSICYQISGLMMDGLCIVVSPLIALIKDQVDQLKKRNVKAIGLTGGISQEELGDILDNCVYGNYNFLYLSPERLQQPLVMERLRTMRIGLIAVDEAHCISQWGHDFRPAYRTISTLKEFIPNTPILAVTATATKQVQHDILENLNISKEHVFSSSFERSNIAYTIIDTQDKRTAFINHYKDQLKASITYVRSRKNAIDFAHLLTSNGIKASYYHGGLDTKTRTKNASKWMQDETPVMIATNAFGMGIDKPDVRSVVHMQLPDSLESYYQETGRAGRDGLPSKAVFIYNTNDHIHSQNQFLNAQASSAFVKTVYRKLNTFLQIAIGDGMDTRHVFSFVQFCKTYDIPGLACYNALQTLDRFSILSLSQGFHRRCRVRFCESGTNILDFTGQHTSINAITQSILRTYGGSKFQQLEIDPVLIALRSNTTEKEVLDALTFMQRHELIEATIIDADTDITFLEPRDDDRTINRFAREIDNQITYKKQKLEAMMAFVTNRTTCLNQLLLAYFDEKTTRKCGKCSNCLTSRNTGNYNNAIIRLLTNNELSATAISDALNIPLEITATQLKELLEMGKIQLTYTNTYTLL